MDIIIAIIIGVIIAFIIVSVMKSELKTVHMQRTATNYVKQNSFKLQISDDKFLYKKIDKTPKQQPQQSAGQKK